jgi:hypothetical protein
MRRSERSTINGLNFFEEFPYFMEGVIEVRQEGEKFLFWKAKIAGRVKEWEVEITNQVPDQRIAWQSIDGSSNSGTITFEEISADWTRVNATIGYEPEGLLEKTGDALGIPSGRIEGDLQRFRDFMEERGRETGGWRGEIGEERAPMWVFVRQRAPARRKWQPSRTGPSIRYPGQRLIHQDAKRVVILSRCLSRKKR